MQSQPAPVEEASLPSGLERAIQSGQLSRELINPDALNGIGDLLLALIEVSRERFFTPTERLREIGRRSGRRLADRLRQRLEGEWGIRDLAELPWTSFTTLLSQLSAGIGMGTLALRVDETSGLIHVCAWRSPFPELLEGGMPTCVTLEGFIASLIEAVSPAELEAIECSCRATGAEVCEFAVGSNLAVRNFVEQHSGPTGSET